jgi:MFS family permease
MTEQDQRPAAPAASAAPFYGYTIVGAAAFSMVLIFSVHYSFGVFFLPLLKEFGWSRAATAGAFSLVWIAQGLLAVVMGGLNDRFGPRLVLTACGILIGTGYLLISQVHAIWHLYLFYGVIVGAGLGGTFVPLTSTTARWFIARRGVMTGVVTAGVGVGALIGPPISSALISGYNWRTSYIILGSVTLIGVTVAAQFLRRDPAQLGLRPYGEAASTSLASSQAASRRPGGHSHGLSLREAAHTWQFWILCAVFLCYGFSLSAVLLHLTPHAVGIGIAASDAAWLVAVIGGASVVGKVLLGSAVDRIGTQRVYLISFVLLAASLASLALITEFRALTMFAVVFGFAYGGLAAAHAPIVAWLFGLKQHGLIFGVSFNGWTVGCALGPIVAGHLFDATGSYRTAFLACAGLSVLGLVLTSILKPVSTASQAVTSTDLSPATT